MADRVKLIDLRGPLYAGGGSFRVVFPVGVVCDACNDEIYIEPSGKDFTPEGIPLFDVDELTLLLTAHAELTCPARPDGQ